MLTKFFFIEDEEELEAAIIEFQKAGFPLTIKCVRQLAWQYASMNNIKGFSTKTKKAGHKWAKYFVKTHPKIIVKKSQELVQCSYYVCK